MRRLPWSSLTMKAPKGSADSARKGSTIVVVIALLLALTFLGIVAYTIGTQEHGNAVYFSDAAKENNFGVSRESLFDWGLRQVILGTDNDTERQSALYGGHMSLIATLFGDDLAPFNGQGVNLAMDTTANIGDIAVDQDYDFNDDGTDYLLELNRAPFSQGASGVGAVDQSSYPSPDVGYTYWDNNNPFLAYVNKKHVIDSSGNIREIVLPSFHRPQYLRSMQPSDGVVPGDEWYYNPLTQTRVLRPHVEDRAVAADGTVTDIRRFVSAAMLPDGMTPGYPDTRPVPASEKLRPFFDPLAFAPNDGVWSGGGNASYDADPDNDGINEAVYLDLAFPMQFRENADGTVTKFVPLFAFTIYDADALFNLNAHGNIAGADPVTLSSQFGPLGSSPVTGATGLGFLSRSNEGLSGSEVNPQYGMVSPLGDTTQHGLFYGRAPLSSVEQSNMEWWFLMSGRADYDTTSGAVEKLYAGRYGDVDDLNSALTSPLNVYNFPKPGQRYTAAPSTFDPTIYTHLKADDNLNSGLGGSYTDQPTLGSGGIGVNNTVFPASVNFPAWRHPLDLNAAGRKTDPNLVFGNALYGKDRFRYQAPGSRYRWPAYDNYDTVPTIDLRTTGYANELMQNYNVSYRVDDPEETMLEPNRLRSDLDSIFGPGEIPMLHLSQADQDVLGLSGRLKSLAPVNFDDTMNVSATEDRRRKYTTDSWDFKAYARSVYGTSTAANKFRNWEVSADFPPTFSGATAGNDPFRPAVRELLKLNPGSKQLAAAGLQRKLSINQLLDYGPDGRLRFRPLTPHPTGLDANPVDSTNSPFFATVAADANPARLALNPQNISSLHDQEFLARRDRQQLCRDIYVLLYTLGGGNDALNYTTDNSMEQLYSYAGKSGTPPTDPAKGDQCRKMAQFAVNLVDQMDEDDVMTVFEYDVNLNNGWNLNDNPFDEAVAQDTAIERRTVVGVERQQLCLNEGQVVLAKHVKQVGSSDPNQSVDFGATQWDDRKNRDWTFLELENVGPTDVNFNNEAWQISVKPGKPGIAINPADPAQQINALIVKDVDGNRMTPGMESVTADERRLTFTGNWSVGTGPNSRLMVGTAGDYDKLGDGMTDPTSVVMVDPNYDPAAMTPPPFIQVVPRLNYNGVNRLDLFSSQAFYRMNYGPSSTPTYPNPPDGLVPLPTSAAPAGDGTEIPESATNPASADLLSLTLQDPTTYLPNPDAVLENDDRNLFVTFELRRRLNPTRGLLLPGGTGNHENQAQDNPWVVVDQLTVPIDVFELDQTAMAATAMDVQEQLTIEKNAFAMRSTERDQPLNGSSAKNSSIAAGFQRNTFGLSNSNAPAAFDLYQSHFDRPFASPVELLSVPLYGPVELINSSGGWRPHFGANRYGVDQQVGNTNLLPTNLPKDDVTKTITSSAECRIAAHKFLQPDFDPGNAASIDDYDNRWYRLFEFIEVPTHQEPEELATDQLVRSPSVLDVGNTGYLADPDTAGNLRSYYRRPGRVQLNTLRDPEVLAGLLDDPEVVRLDTGFPYLGDQGGDGTFRDWWIKFLESRDGKDPVTSRYLPGLPYGGIDTAANIPYGSKPFRDFSFSANAKNSIEDTLFRKLPGSAATSPDTDRLLFELGTQNEHVNANVDHSMRHRMLSKVLNNSTTRSNVFLIFAQVDFFEAAEEQDTATGKTVVRVGAKLTDSPAYRAFFVVDRSKIAQTLSDLKLQNPGFDPNLDFLPPTSFTDPVDGQPKFNFNFNQNFDFRPLILHRQTIN